MTGESVDLGQCFHNETGVVVIDEIANAIDSIEPGTIGILALEHEVQVSFRDVPVILIGEKQRSAR